ncbi:MAG: metal-dependent hydrolase [Oscillospiraceae bacterium]
MQGKTHITGAIALTTLATQPQTIGELLLCIGVSAVGGAICDIDVDGSIGSKKLKQISGFGVIVLIFLIVALLMGKAEFSIVMNKENSIIRTIFGIAMMFLLCWFGRKQPHRTFMHSILGVVLISFSSYLIFTEIWIYMALGMISHIILDLFNKKKIQLLYPIKKPKFSLGLCYADSLPNTILFYVFSVMSILEVILLLYRMFVH